MTIINEPFDLNHPHGGDLFQSAYTALSTALNVQPRERVLIMANPDGGLPDIAMAVYNAALELRAQPVLMFQATRSRVDLADPAVLAAIETTPEVMFTITKESLGNDPKGLANPYRIGDLTFNHIFYYLIAKNKSRGAWCPSADVDIFRRAVPVDYPLMWQRSLRLKKLFDNALEIHVTTPAGTDLHIDLKDREGMTDDGDYRRPGTGGNLPAGEVFAVPGPGSYGIAVLDGSIALLGGTLIPRKPIKVVIEDGKFVEITGDTEAGTLRENLKKMKDVTNDQIGKGIISSNQADAYRANCNNLAEFGVGLNPAAVISGNMTEDEKVLDTCHIAMGDDCYGYAPAVAHLDMIMLHPTMIFTLEDGETVEVDPLNPPDLK